MSVKSVFYVVIIFFSILVCIAEGSPIFYTFRGPVSLVWMGTDEPPPAYTDDCPDCYRSEDGLWAKGEDFGSITHVIMIDYEESGTVTDEDGNVSFFDYYFYADYIWGSLDQNATHVAAENNYIYVSSEEMRNLFVSSGDNQLNLYSPGHLEAHPDFGGNWEIGKHVSSGEGFLTITSIADTMPIPEPETVFLLGAGLAGFIGRRITRKEM